MVTRHDDVSGVWLARGWGGEGGRGDAGEEEKKEKAWTIIPELAERGHELWPLTEENQNKHFIK